MSRLCPIKPLLRQLGDNAYHASPALISGEPRELRYIALSAAHGLLQCMSPDAAFWDIVDANRSPIDGELADVLDDLGNPVAVTLEQVISKANNKFADWLEDPKNQRAIPHRFEQCGYVSVRKPDRRDNLWRINKRRQVIYVLSDLSCRDQLEAAENLARKYELKM